MSEAQSDMFAIGPEEQTAAFAAPAPFANRVIVNSGSGLFRLAFIERVSDGVTSWPPAVRAAVTMPVADVIGLRDALTRVLDAVHGVAPNGD